MVKDDWDRKLDCASYYNFKDKWWQIESPSSFALAFLGIAVVIGSGWYFFGFDDQDPSKPIPLIQAASGPSKIRPENAGKTNVPHQDKLVYNRLNSNENAHDVENNVEHLLPPPETPVIVEQKTQLTSDPQSTSELNNPLIMAKDDMEKRDSENHNFPAFKTSSAPPSQRIKQGEKLDETVAKTRVILDDLSSEHNNKKKEILQKNQVQQELQNEAVFKNIKPLARQLSDSTRQPPKGGFCIQIASLPSLDLAKKEWLRLQKSYALVLSNQTPHFARVDLGATKGVYHRIQVGHFKNKQEAQAMCSRLPKLGCLIVPK
ncbi:MAG: SPOR domain-containing protein [Alphaproteobacteria bacterium]|nr:SPOR domain-containing protein [Alphaproteobacteria bacterium]